MLEADRRNIEAVRQMYEGNEAERAAIAANIVWHVPGHNPVSGDYHGFEEYTRLMPSRMEPLSRWEFRLEDLMVNGSYVMVTFHLQGERKGKSLDLKGGHLMRLDGEGRIVEGWGFANDQAALDEFFSA